MSERFDAIDYIKTLAIIAVVFTHSVLTPSMGLHSHWDDLLGRGWVSFHVPAFLAVSGFLYQSSTPIDGQKVLERLLRVLLPYVVASFVALALGDVPASGPGFWERLATGNTQGHYYYVVLIAAYIPLTWLMSRMPRSWLYGLIVFLIAYPLLAYHIRSFRFSETMLTRMRNPVYTGVYFVGGWVVRMALPQIRSILSTQRPRLVVGVSAGVAISLMLFYFIGPFQGKNWQLQLGNRMLYTAGVILFVCVFVKWLEASLASPGAPPAWVRFMSRSTYTIYLYHFFFIYPVRSATLELDAPLRIFCVALASLAGGCLVAFLAQRLLGDRSRWVFG